MNGISFYKEEIRDCNAVYFTEEFFNVKNDGSIDVSNELQNAIKTVVDKAGYGVLFIPEGEYLLSKTIYVPKAVRLIGYGDNRPHFILKDNAEGFNEPHPENKGGFKYLFWFVKIPVLAANIFLIFRPSSLLTPLKISYASIEP